MYKLINYIETVIGCPDISTSSHARVEITGGMAFVTCGASGVTHEMQCVENKWEGSFMECSPGSKRNILGIL